MENIDKYKKILTALGIDESVREVRDEILDYCENRFNVGQYKPGPIEDEPFVDTWRSIINDIHGSNINEVMNSRLPHGDEDIKLKSPEKVSIEIYNSIAGNIPVIYAKDEEDFYEIVKKLIYKDRPAPNLEKTGASFAYGRTNRFIILSNKPYSNIPASKLGLEDEQWRNYSIIIRREHECTHYFTKRFLGSSQNNLHDELIADFTGIMCAVGEFKAKWFLSGMGIDMYPEKQEVGRFPVYTSKLSEQAADFMKKIIIKAANNVEEWSKKESVKQMSRNERVIFLCSKSILDLYMLY